MSEALTPDSADLPVLDLDALSSDPDQRVAIFSDIVRPMADFAGLGWRGSEGLERVRVWLLDELIVSELRLRAHVMERQRVHLQKYPKATILLRWHIEGQTSNELGIEAYQAGPGQIHLTDMTELYSGIATANHVFAVAIAHETVGYDPSSHPVHIPIVPSRGEESRIPECFSMLASAVQRGDAAAARAAASGLVEDVRIMLEAQVPTVPQGVNLRRLQMRAFIEKCLADADLSADSIAKEFSTSRATVYRDIETFGGLKRYILRRRLEEACKELVFGRAERGAVAAAAQRWHFSSMSHFSREFKRQFGVPPSDAVNTALFRLAPDDPRQPGKTTARAIPPWLERI